jgi:hypothetical protein
VSAAKKKRGGIPLLALFRNKEAREQMRRHLDSPFTRIAPRLRAELERYLAEVQTDPPPMVIEEIQGLLDQRARARQGGRPESVTTAHIRELVAANPTVKPAPLYRLRDRSIIKSMNKGSWRTRVAEARRK